MLKLSNQSVVPASVAPDDPYLEAIALTHLAKQTGFEDRQKLLRYPKKEVEGRFDAFSRQVYQKPLEMRRWCPVKDARLPVDTVLYKLATRSLTPQNYLEGYIYVYQVDTNPGFYKIGRTAKRSNERIKAQERRCKYTAEVVFPPDMNKAIPIPHASRVEKLIHAELKDYRHEQVECKCGVGRHLEWFKTSEAHIKAVIQKWTSWINTSPYEESTTIKRGELVSFGQLKAGRQDSLLESVCRPVQVRRKGQPSWS